eukprot:298228-Hanusia_phi.AAC.6
MAGTEDDASAYERLREENIQRNNALLSSLGIPSLASQLDHGKDETLSAQNTARKKRKVDETELVPTSLAIYC